jgi:hypothetical protein
MRTTALDLSGARLSSLPPGFRPACAGAKRMAACFLLLLGSFSAVAAPKTPLNVISGLATALGENDPDGALEFFDSKMDAYGEIEQKIEAVTAQDDISCSIEIVTDTEVNGVHKLDLDWFMHLKTQGAAAQVEERRERVAVEMRQIKGVWKITSIAPLKVLDAIEIK